jgi:hypothetical protein
MCGSNGPVSNASFNLESGHAARRRTLALASERNGSDVVSQRPGNLNRFVTKVTIIYNYWGSKWAIRWYDEFVGYLRLLADRPTGLNLPKRNSPSDWLGQ